MAILGVDVGGTFTDAVLLDGGRLSTAKVVTARDQEESVVAAARAAGAEDVERFAHGTTVATNALLERKGARTAFVTTAGFEHMLHLRRQTRAHLYRPCAAWPEPLVPLERCHGVRGRMGPEGELEPLDVSSLPEMEADAVAVCLLHAYRDPSHERAVAAEVRRRLPHTHVVASHEVAPEFREYERASTTAADAYLGPVVSRYLGALAGACAAARLPEPLVMRSSGGVATPSEAAAHPATVLVSGPAAGVVGAARIAALAGIEDAIAFDMGGTSTDVCLIAGARAERAGERMVGGLPIRLPTVDLHTVGAGGGSLVWRDAGRSHLVPLSDAGELPTEGEADLRYAGQSFELTVPLQDDLASAFHRAHEELYGFAEPERQIELVAVRTADVRPGPHIELRASRERSAEGPTVVELPGATVWVPAGWAGAGDPHGTLVLRRR